MREGVVIGVLLFGTLVFAGLFSSCQSRDPFLPTETPIPIVLERWEIGIGVSVE